MASPSLNAPSDARAAQGPTLASSPRARARVAGEKVIAGWIFLCGITSIVLVALIFLFVLREAFPLVREYPLLRFLGGREWTPVDDYHPEFGLLPLLLSSLLVTLGAVAIAVPLGVMSAIFIGEIAPPRLRNPLKTIVELLASVPSVVLGFFGLTVLGPLLQRAGLPTGNTMIAGSITLAFMAIPTIATISEDALGAVARDIREGSLGLGATRWQTIRHVVLPAAASGIVAAIMLGVGRAIGETMVVLMVTGNGVGLNLTGLMNNTPAPLGAFSHVFGAYGEICRTLTATIASEMGEVTPGETHYHALFLLGVVLFVITFAINAIADFALRRSHRAGGKG